MGPPERFEGENVSGVRTIFVFGVANGRAAIIAGAMSTAATSLERIVESLSVLAVRVSSKLGYRYCDYSIQKKDRGVLEAVDYKILHQVEDVINLEEGEKERKDRAGKGRIHTPAPDGM